MLVLSFQKKKKIKETTSSNRFERLDQVGFSILQHKYHSDGDRLQMPRLYELQNLLRFSTIHTGLKPVHIETLSHLSSCRLRLTSSYLNAIIFVRSEVIYKTSKLGTEILNFK